MWRGYNIKANDRKWQAAVISPESYRLEGFCEYLCRAPAVTTDLQRQQCNKRPLLHCSHQNGDCQWTQCSRFLELEFRWRTYKADSCSSAPASATKPCTAPYTNFTHLAITVIMAAPNAIFNWRQARSFFLGIWRHFIYTQQRITENKEGTKLLASG